MHANSSGTWQQCCVGCPSLNCGTGPNFPPKPCGTEPTSSDLNPADGTQIQADPTGNGPIPIGLGSKVIKFTTAAYMGASPVGLEWTVLRSGVGIETNPMGLEPELSTIPQDWGYNLANPLPRD